MKLKKVELKNIFQYDELEIEFTGNLVGICGRNGTGKSNFLNALHFAFSGEVPGKTKEQVLKWGTENGYVSVEFEHQGKPGKITRYVPGVKATLTYGGETVSGIRKVDAAVLETLGMDKDIFRLVFVKQAELDAILFDQASRREVAFQRMCGLGEANRLHKNFKDLIAEAFKETDGDIEAELATLTRCLEEGETELKAEKEALEKVESDLGQDVDKIRQELTDRMNKYRQAGRLKYAMRSNDEAFRKLEADYIQASQQLQALGETVTRDIVGKAQAELEKASSALSSREFLVENCKSRQTRLENNRTTVATVEHEAKSLAGVDGLQAELEAETAKIAQGTAMSNLYKTALAALSVQSSPTCPLCGSPMSGNLSAEFEARLTSCYTNPARRIELQKAIEAQRHKAAELSGRMTALLASISEDEAWLKANPCPDAAQLDNERTTVSQMREFVRNIADRCTQAEQLSWKINSLASEIGNRKAQREVHEQELVRLGVPAASSCDDDENEAKLAETSLQEQADLLAKKNTCEALVASTERRLIGIRQNIETAKRKKANVANRETAYRTLNQVADWFHYSNGPHKLAAKILEDLTADTNGYLETLDSPFSVSIDPETLGYRFSMNDGSGPAEPQPAEALSGGQKVLLAVAFRLASYCMFAGRYGLMALDEPTAYLDDSNVSNFCTLLESIKAMAVSMDLQILISTHERAVLPCMDSVLDIDAEKA